MPVTTAERIVCLGAMFLGQAPLHESLLAASRGLAGLRDKARQRMHLSPAEHMELTAA